MHADSASQRPEKNTPIRGLRQPASMLPQPRCKVLEPGPKNAFKACQEANALLTHAAGVFPTFSERHRSFPSRSGGEPADRRAGPSHTVFADGVSLRRRSGRLQHDLLEQCHGRRFRLGAPSRWGMGRMGHGGWVKETERQEICG